jgi:hypothetical protein
VITPHACFEIGYLAGIGTAFVVAALFGWGFIAYCEGWPLIPGRLIEGWRNRR